MIIGGGSLWLTKVSRTWVPEKRTGKTDSIYRNKAIQILMLEGCFIGFGWGAFDVTVPAYATLKGVAYRTAWILAVMGIFTIIGGLLAGLVSKNTSPLGAMKKVYLLWLIVSLPLALTHPDWTLIICGALLGLAGGALQVFYWEVLERVRPKGTAMASLGWLWTVEGSFAAIGAAAGGLISEYFHPQIALGTTTACVAIGALILVFGRKRLAAADQIPTEQQDLAAMEDNLDINK
jgi:predicted MFS family arabinose efflux permease